LPIAEQANDGDAGKTDQRLDDALGRRRITIDCRPEPEHDQGTKSELAQRDPIQRPT